MKKRPCFERNNGRVHGKVWWDEKEGGNYIIVLYSQKILSFLNWQLPFLSSTLISLLCFPECLHHPLKFPNLKFLGQKGSKPRRCCQCSKHRHILYEKCSNVTGARKMSGKSQWSGHTTVEIKSGQGRDLIWLTRGFAVGLFQEAESACTLDGCLQTYWLGQKMTIILLC